LQDIRGWNSGDRVSSGKKKKRAREGKGSCLDNKTPFQPHVQRYLLLTQYELDLKADGGNLKSDEELEEGGVVELDQVWIHLQQRAGSRLGRLQGWLTLPCIRSGKSPCG
jgi:hypothetical protein